MNWLTNWVRPKLSALVARKETPENLWLKCPGCETMLFHRDLEANQRVCTNCGHHLRIGPRQRQPALFDEGTFETHPLPRTIVDPLKFRDSKRYADRLKAGFQNSKIAFEVHETFAIGSLVANYRTDTIVGKNGKQAFRVGGVFYLKDGKISEWIDSVVNA